MSREAILAAIPHRAPFLLVDEIVEEEPTRIVCRKTFREDEFWYPGHYPNFPITPGVLLCEAAMQAGAVLLARQVLAGDSSAAGKVPVATRLGEVRFKQMVRPGDTIEIETVLKEQLSGAFFLTAKVTVREGKLAARLDFACTLTNRLNAEL